jgi:hypothetical protein
MRRALLLTLWLVVLSHPSAACYDGLGPSGQKRFILKGDDAFDSKTGLTWKRCSARTSKALQNTGPRTRSASKTSSTISTS